MQTKKGKTKAGICDSLLETAPESPFRMEDPKAKTEAKCLPLSAKGMSARWAAENAGKQQC